MDEGVPDQRTRLGTLLGSEGSRHLLPNNTFELDIAKTNFAYGSQG